MTVCVYAGILRINLREILPCDYSVLNHGYTNSADSVVISVWCFYVKDYIAVHRRLPDLKLDVDAVCIPIKH